MKPEDIRRLYRAETAATEQESAAQRAQLRSDPDEARRLLQTLYALSTEDRDFALLLRLFLEGMLMRLVEERAATDDAYALACAALIADLMDAMQRPPRGRARPARSA